MRDYQSTIEICRRRYIFQDFLCFHSKDITLNGCDCCGVCVCVKNVSYNVFL